MRGKTVTDVRAQGGIVDNHGAGPRSIGLIGTGVIGREVAWACAVHGYDVVLFDIDRAASSAARDQIERWIADPSERRLPAGSMGTVTIAADLAGCVSDVDLVFENVIEDVGVKRALYRDIEPLMKADTPIGSNASSIPWTPLAERLTRPDRFFLANFTSPRRGRLVEYMGGERTSERTRALALSWLRGIGMVPVPVQKEIMGYVRNRIWRAIKKECLFLVDQGYATPSDVDRAYVLAEGTPFGPFARMDKIGLHSILKIEQRYYDASGDPSDRPAQCLIDLVAAGNLGTSTGQGFYRYPDPAYERPGWLEGQE